MIIKANISSDMECWSRDNRRWFGNDTCWSRNIWASWFRNDTWSDSWSSSCFHNSQNYSWSWSKNI